MTDVFLPEDELNQANSLDFRTRSRPLVDSLRKQAQDAMGGLDAATAVAEPPAPKSEPAPEPFTIPPLDTYTSAWKQPGGAQSEPTSGGGSDAAPFTLPSVDTYTSQWRSGAGSDTSSSGGRSSDEFQAANPDTNGQSIDTKPAGFGGSSTVELGGGGAGPQGAVDKSSPDAFIRSVMPYAKQVEAETGIPASIMVGIASNETGYGRAVAGNNYFGIKGSNPRTGANTGAVPTWEVINGQRVNINDTFRAYDNPADSFRDFADFLKSNPRYAPALQTLRETGDPEAFIRAVHAAGYATDPNWSSQVLSIAKNVPDTASLPVAGNVGGSVYAAGNLTPNQFGEGLSTEDAYAACGPAAAIAFARRTGRNPTMQEALQLAKANGWTPEQGMAGPASQVKTLQDMGIASKLEQGVDWQKVASDVQGGNPVTISTPGHYFVAERYDPNTGKFDFGNSAKALRASGGNTWFTPAELSSLGMGQPTASIFLDNPESPSPSVVAGGSDAGQVPSSRFAAESPGSDSTMASDRAYEPAGASGSQQSSSNPLASAFHQLADKLGDGLKQIGDMLGGASSTAAGTLNNASDALAGALNTGAERAQPIVENVAGDVGELASDIGKASDLSPEDQAATDRLIARIDQAEQSRDIDPLTANKMRGLVGATDTLRRTKTALTSGIYEPIAQRVRDDVPYANTEIGIPGTPIKTTAADLALGLTPLGNLSGPIPGLPGPGKALAGPASSAATRFLEEQGNRVASGVRSAASDAVGAAGRAVGGALERLGQQGEMVPIGLEARQVTDQPMAPTFYSQLARTIDEKMPNRASPAQIQGILRGSPVKPDEIKWTGFDDWLRERGNTPVTKQEVQDFLRQNEVQVEEVVKGSVDRSEAWKAEQALGDALREKGWNPAEVDRIVNHPDDYMGGDLGILRLAQNLEQVRADLRNADLGSPTKFGAYQLPGGTEYRELLLTLPDQNAGTQAKIDDVYGQYRELARLENPTPAQEAHADELYAEFKRLEAIRNQTPSYRSGHWDEPNILAHVRFNDRVDAQGKKVLFVEEVQSDWHQAGRDKGYQHPQSEADLQRIRELQDRYRQRPLSLAELGELAALNRRGKSGVPDAPFSKSWPELAMKRVIRWAAEQNATKEAQNWQSIISSDMERVASVLEKNGIINRICD